MGPTYIDWISYLFPILLYFVLAWLGARRNLCTIVVLLITKQTKDNNIE